MPPTILTPVRVRKGRQTDKPNSQTVSTAMETVKIYDRLKFDFEKFIAIDERILGYF